MHVADEAQQRRKPHLPGDAELVRGLDAVDDVEPGAGEAEHLRPRALGLQQVGREVGCAGKRVAHAAEHLALARLDELRRVALECRAEGVVGG